MYCKKCLPRAQPGEKKNKKLSDYIKYRGYQIHSQVRENARSVYRKSNKPKECTNCGYKHHYHVCHIQAIKNFSSNTQISTINHPDNLIALCPNCHWELDHGLLTLYGLRELDI